MHDYYDDDGDDGGNGDDDDDDDDGDDDDDDDDEGEWDGGQKSGRGLQTWVDGAPIARSRIQFAYVCEREI